MIATNSPAATTRSMPASAQTSVPPSRYAPHAVEHHHRAGRCARGSPPLGPAVLRASRRPAGPGRGDGEPPVRRRRPGACCRKPGAAVPSTASPAAGRADEAEEPARRSDVGLPRLCSRMPVPRRCAERARVGRSERALRDGPPLRASCGPTARRRRTTTRRREQHTVLGEPVEDLDVAGRSDISERDLPPRVKPGVTWTQTDGSPAAPSSAGHVHAAEGSRGRGSDARRHARAVLRPAGRQIAASVAQVLRSGSASGSRCSASSRAIETSESGRPGNASTVTTTGWSFATRESADSGRWTRTPSVFGSGSRGSPGAFADRRALLMGLSSPP